MERAAALTLRQQGQPSRLRGLKLHYIMLPAAKSRAEAAAVKAAAATQNLAAAQKKAADAASDAAKKNDRTKASLDGIKNSRESCLCRACGRSSCSRHELR